MNPSKDLINVLIITTLIIFTRAQDEEIDR